jgi:hypothetical protein
MRKRIRLARAGTGYYQQWTERFSIEAMACSGALIWI